MNETILLPTDGSAGMGRVVEHALSAAREHDATMHTLYVVDSGSVTGVPMDVSWSGIAATLEREGEQALEAVERLADDDVDIVRTITEGEPAREIVGYVRENDIDRVVMGTHGCAGLDRLLLGSVAERVVRRAPVPVTTVKLGPHTDRRPPDLDPDQRNDDPDRSGDRHYDDHRPRRTPDTEPEPEPGAR
jgi:nucleotide-binding universal stress UspA family protein